MESVTLTIAAIGCLLVLFFKPVQGLAVYVVLAMWYPYGVGTVSVGTIDFSVGRIVIIVLLFKTLIGSDLATKFKVMWLDRFIVILFIAEVVAGATTVEMMDLIENRAGDFFDMGLPYFAVRLIITDKNKFLTLLKAITWSAGILAVFAGIESLTGNNLLKLGRTLPLIEKRLIFFSRAQTTFRHPIYYGVFSTMAAAICMGSFKSIKNASNYKILVVMIFLGCFFSMSSGGLLAMVGALSFIFFYKYRYYWKNVIIAIVIMCCVVEVLSNRHFYDVIDRFCFNGATAWYRARLFEVAFFEGGMSGHWVTGFGMEDPMWGLRIDMRKHTDMVNHYLLELCRYGLVGFIPFCAVIIAAIKSLFKNFWSINNDSDRWIIWCTAGSLFGVLLAFNSVSLFGQPMTLLYMLFGFCVTLPLITHRKNN